MSEETYARLSRKGKRRARIIYHIETLIIAVFVFGCGLAAAAATNTVCHLLGV